MWFRPLSAAPRAKGAIVTGFDGSPAGYFAVTRYSEENTFNGQAFLCFIFFVLEAI